MDRSPKPAKKIDCEDSDPIELKPVRKAERRGHRNRAENVSMPCQVSSESEQPGTSLPPPKSGSKHAPHRSLLLGRYRSRAAWCLVKATSQKTASGSTS